MIQYKQLLQTIIDNGVEKSDRTNTGTRSIFGHQMRFNLSEGFPLVTTKKVFTKGIIHELLWFLSGNTNIKYLLANGVNIWNEWADEYGNLGPVYGKAWRSFGSKPESIIQPKPKLKSGVEPTYLSVANGSGKEGKLLKKTWEGMIDRCYNKRNIMYKHYGYKGVYVCDRWLEYSAFEEDAKNLPGWSLKEQEPRKYSLDKDGIGNGFVYSSSTCQWITNVENANLKNEYIYTVEKDNKLYTFTNPTDFCQKNDIEGKNFSDLWTGNKNAKIRDGFKFVSKVKKDKGIDQIANLISEIKQNPDSRRLIISAWDPSWLKYGALPPCHTMFQFYVANGKLSCQLYQRSADVFLGVPFNIASYALLTHMIAQVCGLGVGEFVHTLGDAHLYLNHMDQAKEQLQREPLPLPQLILNPEIKGIDDFKYEDISIVNYNSHPAIKAPISV
jgi:thymidylate synthase